MAFYANAGLRARPVRAGLNASAGGDSQEYGSTGMAQESGSVVAGLRLCWITGS